MNPVPERLRRAEATSPRRHQQLELLQHFFGRRGIGVAPIENPLGGVAPADEIEPGPGAVVLPVFPRNIDEQALIRRADRIRRWQPGRSQHRNALLERGPKVLLMGEFARHHAQDLVHVQSGGAG